MADVPDDTRRIDALRLVSDLNAPPTAGLALAMLCSALSGTTPFGSFDIREGIVDIAPDEPRVTISLRDRTGRPVAINYGGPAQNTVRLISIPIPAIRALVSALL